MANFFLKLIPPRPDFAMTLTPDERAQMGEHAAYIRGFYDQGKVLSYGPVFSQDEGSYGFGILDVADLAEAETMIQNDPTVRSGLNRYTLAPMMLGGAQAPQTSA